MTKQKYDASKIGTDTLETNLQDLELLTSRLEQREVSLSDSLADFQEGVKLVRESQKKLESAEQVVRKLIEKDPGPVTSDNMLEESTK